MWLTGLSIERLERHNSRLVLRTGGRYDRFFHNWYIGQLLDVMGFHEMYLQMTLLQAPYLEKRYAS